MLFKHICFKLAALDAYDVSGDFKLKFRLQLAVSWKSVLHQH